MDYSPPNFFTFLLLKSFSSNPFQTDFSSSNGRYNIIVQTIVDSLLKTYNLITIFLMDYIVPFIMVSHMLKGLGNIVNYNYLLVSPNLISKHIVPSRLKI